MPPGKMRVDCRRGVAAASRYCSVAVTNRNCEQVQTEFSIWSFNDSPTIIVGKQKTTPMSPPARQATTRPAESQLPTDSLEQPEVSSRSSISENKDSFRHSEFLNTRDNYSRRAAPAHVWNQDLDLRLRDFKCRSKKSLSGR